MDIKAANVLVNTNGERIGKRERESTTTGHLVETTNDVCYVTSYLPNRHHLS